MIRTINWKYVWNLTAVDELYDLANDPFEMTNRIGDESCESVLTSLRMQLHKQLTRYGDIFIHGWAGKQLTDGRKVSNETP